MIKMSFISFCSLKTIKEKKKLILFEVEVWPLFLEIGASYMICRGASCQLLKPRQKNNGKQYYVQQFLIFKFFKILLQFHLGFMDSFLWKTASINTTVLSFIVMFKATATMIKTSFTTSSSHSRRDQSWTENLDLRETNKMDGI